MSPLNSCKISADTLENRMNFGVKIFVQSENSLAKTVSQLQTTNKLRGP
jgi:hypothetical protein